MDPLKIDQKHLESISSRLLEKGINLSLEDVHEVADLIKDEILYWYVNRLITQAERILDIDPGFTEREILKLRSEDHRGIFWCGGRKHTDFRS